jgi:hypothetical protein
LAHREESMRVWLIVSLMAAAFAFPASAIAAKAKSGSGSDMGSFRDKCRAEAGNAKGSQKQALVQACVLRNSGK